jgi:ribose-phosphate pyrophosphokinase
MLLNLCPSFKPCQGEEIKFESFLFPGGEPHIKIDTAFDVAKEITITHRLNSFSDVGLLCLAVDALRRMHANVYQLIIPYFPAARQDRLMTAGEPLSIKVYADIINCLRFKKVVVFDPHSDVLPAVLNNCAVVNNHAFITKIVDQLPSDIMLISPDAGANKKIFTLSQVLGGIPVVECGKKRNVQDGSLTGFTVPATDLEGKPCLIVDDICDGGGTFVGLAKELKHKNAGQLYLAVSHGIFSKGFEPLRYFEKIFTTDSIRIEKSEFVTQIKLIDGLLP